MKILTIITLVASSAAAQVIVGTNSFDVVFEAENLAPAAQSRIVDDINLCRQLWTNSVVYLDGNEFEQGISDGNIIARPYFNDMRAPRDLVTNSAGAWSLLVTKQVSDAYLKAFEFADANNDIIRAADAFVDMISHSNIVCNTADEFLEYVLISPIMQTEFSEDFEYLRGLEFSKPSVMAFGYRPIGPEPSPGVTSNLFMKLQYRSTEIVSIDQMPCIWHNGKWKIYLWNYR